MKQTRRYTGVHLEYVPGTLSDQEYNIVDAARVSQYLGSITAPTQLERTLADDFTQVDGGILGLPQRVELAPNLLVVQGKRPFIDTFRTMVSRQTMPDGMIRGVWIPPQAYEPIETQIRDKLAEDGTARMHPRGRLLGVAAVHFPNRLGDMPLDLPPPFHILLDSGEQPFAPLRAEEHPGPFGIDVVQAVYYDDGAQQFTGRTGLVVNERAVPLAINRQYTDPAYHIPSPMQVAQSLIANS